MSSEAATHGAGDHAGGLMAFWASIEPQDQLAFARWHNCEHIPERVAIEGFLRGRRYRSAADANRFLMFYETRSAQVLESPGYLAALNAPTTRTRQALGWFRDPARSVFKLERQAGCEGTRPAPVLVVACFDATEMHSAPDPAPLLAATAFTRIRMYRGSGSAGSVSTSESAIHGARPDARNGLLLAESFDLALADEPAALRRLRLDMGDALRGTALATAVPEAHWLEFALDRGPDGAP